MGAVSTTGNYLRQPNDDDDDDDDGVSSSVEVMVATGDFLPRWCYL